MITRQNLQDLYPLSPMQEGMLYHWLLAPDSEVYCEQVSYHLNGELDFRLFYESWNQVLRRHDVLRTVFVHEKVARPLQMVLREASMGLYVEDLSEMPAEDRLRRVEAYRCADRARGFNLTRDLLTRVAVFRRGEDDYEILWSFHHIILDGWSVGLLMADWLEHYAAARAGRGPRAATPIPYSRYITFLEQSDRQASAHYWREQLAGYIGVATIPSSRPPALRPAPGSTHLANRAEYGFDAEETRALTGCARALGITMAALLQGLWALVLSRYRYPARDEAAAHDIAFGMVVSGRAAALEDVERIVGLFTNTVPLRVRFREDEPLAAMLQRVGDASIAAQEHAHLPLAEIQTAPGMIDHAFAFENFPRDVALAASIAKGDFAFEVAAVESFEQTPYNLSMIINPSGDALSVCFCFDESFHSTAQVDRLFGQLEAAAAGAIAHPTARIADLDLVSAKEAGEIAGFGFGESVELSDQTLHARVRAAAERAPDAPAIIAGNKVFSYGEVDQKAGQVAASLRGQHRVGPGQRVGVVLERSAELPISALGIMRAGAVYVPIDPVFPVERVAFIVNDSECGVVVTTRDRVPSLEEVLPNTRVVDVATLMQASPHSSSLPQAHDSVSADDCAYVVYTSGSTGAPKGVAIAHRGVVNLAGYLKRELPVTPDDRVVLFASPSFDASMWETWSAWCNGAALVVAPPLTVKDPRRFGELLRRHACTIAVLPPSYAQLVDAGDLSVLKTLVTGGEAARAETASALSATLRFINAYGPSEATIHTTSHVVAPSDGVGTTIPIGRPIDNVDVMVLDTRGRPSAIGAPGELCIGGVAVGLGYLNRPELTAERFPPHPTRAGERIYRTGDLVRWLDDGTLEFAGRTDDQVKVRGYRVEPGEIEARLLAHPQIRQAAVLALPGEDAIDLVAFVVPVSVADLSAVRAHLRAALPEYMVPARIVQLAALPSTPQGKVDRAALAAADTYQATTKVAARNELEGVLQRIWQAVLGVDEIGVHDNFFDSGGHSLKAVRLTARIRKDLGQSLELRELYQRPTIAELADLLRARRSVDSGPIPRLPDAPTYAVSNAQRRLWLLEHLTDAAAYNISGAYVLDGLLDVNALDRALQALVARHESLRTTFVEVDGEPRQRVARPASELLLQPVDVSPASDPEAAWREILAAEVGARFDLEHGPLLRCTLVVLGPTRFVLIIVLHHIIADGWSIDVLTRELSELYQARVEGRPAALPPLPLQYRDIAAWQNDRASDAAREFWHRALAGPLPVLELPTDRPRPRQRSSAGATARYAIDRATSDRLNALARRHGASLFMVLTAAVKTLLYRYTRQPNLIVGYPAAARAHPDLEGQVGFFINTIALRSTVTGDQPFVALLDRVKEASLEALAHQDYPFDRLVQELGVPRDASRHPVFDVMVAMETPSEDPLHFPGILVSPQLVDTRTSKFDLLFAFTEAARGIEGAIEYAAELFDAATIERLRSHLETLLGGIADAPETMVSHLPLLTDRERRLVLAQEESDAAGATAETIVSRFTSAVAKNPDRLAVVRGHLSLTYRELDARSNRLAHRLIAAGAGPGVVVGVSIERTPDLIVGLLGVLKSGAAYLPIDPNLPPARQTLMLDDARAGQCVTASVIASLDHESDADFWDLLTAEALATAVAPAVHPRPQSLAYVMYTSGSTGRPNGVMVEHRNVVALLDAYERVAPAPDDLVGVSLCPIGFDVSVWEIFSCVCSGGTLHLLPVEMAGDPGGFVRALAEQRVTSAYIPPPLVAPFAAAVDRSSEPLALERVLVGVEPIRQRDLQDWRDRLPALHIVNGYGPTETTVCATFLDFKAATNPDARTPIGTAAAGYRVYLLDPDRQPVPIGVHGEIYIGGAGVARGYFNNTRLTDERFMADPYRADGRLYRTGDRGRRLADGNIEFVGRVDHQVKIRGVRIEPGEIVTALETHPRVHEAAVLASEPHDGARRLVAYLATADATTPTAAELRAHLQQRLPDVMIPAAFVRLPTLPRTANGKIDRDRLPAVDLPADVSEPPKTATEDLLAVIWADVLGVDRVGREQNFFEAGGHSLAAMRVVGRVRDACGVELPLGDVFESPTIAALASRVDALQRAGTPVLPPIRAHREIGFSPLSFAQQRLWFLDQLEPGPAYNVPIGVRLRGDLDVAALERALDAVIRRHDVLRTVFAAVDEVPVQRVLPPSAVTLPLLDLSTIDLDAREAVIQEVAADSAAQTFDLAHDVSWRAQLLRLASDDHALLLTIHHIAVDGWSVSVLLGEMAAVYRSEPALPPLALQYADVARWQRQWLDEGLLEPQLDYWIRTLDGLPPALALPTDHPRRPDRSRRAGVERFVIDAELAAGLARLGRTLDATTFMTLLAAFNVLLSRHAGQHDIAVGTPIANRTRPELEPLIGFFANTLVMRTRLDGDPDFAALVRRVRAASLGAFANQDVPFEQLVETLQPERSLDYTPLFQVLFVMQGRQKDIAVPGLEISPIDQLATTAKFDLTLSIEEREQTLSGALEYDADLFDRRSIQAMVRRFQTLLAAIVHTPDVPISRLPMLTPEERRELVAAAQGPAPASSDTGTVLELFSQQVARTPGGIAVEDGDRSLTYRELDDRANQLAHYLRTFGAGPNVPVGLQIDRSLEQMIALLGILKSGAACLSLDPSYPRERLEFMQVDAGVPHVITRPDLESARRAPRTSPDVTITPHDLLYVLYTSGSTGMPKGVRFPHRILANLVRWGLDGHGFETPARTLQFAPMTFDVSFHEIFTCWASGGTLVLIDEERRRDPEALLAHVTTRSIERLFLPFVALDALAEAAAGCAPGDLPVSLGQVITAGEQLRSTPALRSLFARLPDCELHNHYGPTEAHVVTACQLGPDPEQWPALPPIGRPIAGAHVYVLDEDLEPVPRGVVGELYIGGRVVADGYVKRPDLTAERFIPDPFSPSGSRLYRTGDYARVLADGNIEFLGRRDGQVKIRGFRVEPGEIEIALAGHPGVAQAAVIVDDRPATPRLIACVAAASGAAVDAASLRAHLKASLPEFMVPAGFVVLPSLPLTSSGKIDRRALLALSRDGLVSGRPAGARNPRTPTERALLGIWRDVMRIGEIGIDESFFDLGGHSLLAARLVSRVRAELDVALPLRRLFEAPTIEQLARVIDGAEKAVPEAAPLTRGDASEPAPMSFAQERIWFVHQLDESRAAHNMPAALRLTGDLDVEALGDSVEQMVERHEVLRTRLVSRDGALLQIVQPTLPVVLPVVDVDGANQDAEVARLVGEYATMKFDLAELPLFRFVLLRIRATEHVLVIVLHHAIADGWSIGILSRELMTSYRAYALGTPSVLEPLTVQYADYARWERGAVSGETLTALAAYWRHALAGAPPALDLQGDRQRPATPSFRGRSIGFAFDASETARLHQLARDAGATLHVVLLSAYAVLLHRLTGQDDLVIGTPVAHRPRPELEPLIGLFLNLLPIRVRLSDEVSFKSLCARVQATMLDASDHQALPFEKIVEAAGAARLPSRSSAPNASRAKAGPAGGAEQPLFQAVFVLQNASTAPEAPLPDLHISPVPFENTSAKFDLTIAVEEDAGGLRGSVDYATDVFTPAAAAEVVEAYLAIVRALADRPDDALAAAIGSRDGDQVVVDTGDFAFE